MFFYINVVIAVVWRIHMSKTISVNSVVYFDIIIILLFIVPCPSWYYSVLIDKCFIYVSEEAPPPQISQAIDDILEYGIKNNYITQPFNTKMIYMGY